MTSTAHRMCLRLRHILVCFLVLLLTGSAAAQDLRIHYINVGQGGCTLIVGPNGTSILYDFGAVPGDQNLVPYLRDTLGMTPSQGVDYTMVSHNDKDHYFGYKAFVEAGFDVKISNFSSGSSKTSSTITSHWMLPAKDTTAGAVDGVPVGLQISLGDGAEAIVVAANGRVLGQSEPVAIKDENDRSIALFVRYGGFQYIIDGDLGAGPEQCTDHQTGQRAVQPVVARALLAEGLMTAEHGVDVLHIAHHGSESSTSASYYNAMKPEVGLISVGLNQGSFLHPRQDVVDLVLLGNARAPCVTAPPLSRLFQTENGIDDCSDTGCGSRSGRTLGDITLTTDGKSGYEVSGSNRVHHDFDPETMSTTPSFTFPLDEGPADQPLEDPTPCCKRCRPGISKPCGDACIAVANSCSRERGCACGG